jgi:hypothetical protein
MGTVTNTKGIPGFDAEEEARDEAGKPEGRGDAEDDANDGKAHAMPHDERTDVCRMGYVLSVTWLSSPGCLAQLADLTLPRLAAISPSGNRPSFSFLRTPVVIEPAKLYWC